MTDQLGLTDETTVDITVYDPAEDPDGDRIINAIDLDDDNDGILDTNEGSCIESGSLDKTGYVVTDPGGVGYTMNSGRPLAEAIDGVDNNTFVFRYPYNAPILTNTELFRVQLPTAKALTYWEVAHYSGQTLFGYSGASTYKVQGSNDGTNWTDLTDTLTYSSSQNGESTQDNNSNIATFAGNTSAYSYYRYYGINVNGGTGWVTEFISRGRVILITMVSKIAWT